MVNLPQVGPSIDREFGASHRHSPHRSRKSNERVTAIHVSLCQQKSTSFLYARWRARCGLIGIDGCARLPLG